MSRRIRDDFEGVVYLPGDPLVTLKAGDEEPEGVTFGDHLLAADPPSTSPVDVLEASYEGLTVSELKTNIALRNEGRAESDLIPTDGLKADLVAALEADVAKTTAASSDS